MPSAALDAGDPALAGLIEAHGGRLVLAPRGRLLASEVAPPSRPARRAAARLAAGARPGDLLLAHDGGADRSTTVQALPDHWHPPGRFG